MANGIVTIKSVASAGISHNLTPAPMAPHNYIGTVSVTATLSLPQGTITPLTIAPVAALYRHSVANPADALVKTGNMQNIPLGSTTWVANISIADTDGLVASDILTSIVTDIWDVRYTDSDRSGPVRVA